MSITTTRSHCLRLTGFADDAVGNCSGEACLTTAFFTPRLRCTFGGCSWVITGPSLEEVFTAERAEAIANAICSLVKLSFWG